MNAPPESAAGPVLFFDGGCGLCHRVVRLLLRLDGDARLRFAPLQSQSAQVFLRAHGLRADNFDTLVFVPEWTRRDAPEFLLRTTGIIAALRRCGSVGRLLAGLIAFFPAAVRDAVYRFVARMRYRIFGSWLECPLPQTEWATRFLT